MKLQLYYSKQLELEKFVCQNIGMEWDEFSSVPMTDKRVFAFKVELAEFANETAWFKYWKQSHIINRENTLEEFADCIHFMVAIGLHRKYNQFVPALEWEQWVERSDDFLYTAIMENGIASSGNWKRCFEQLLAIGIKLGFTLEEIELAYLLKNQKNIERQTQKY
jgi:dimeric dUTPase (all-alpha-NTP-PPase superfamily)